jgi:transposase InsO family protein
VTVFGFIAAKRAEHSVKTQGSQFVSLAFGQQARAAGIAQSMGSAET